MFVKRLKPVSILVVLALALMPVNGYCLPEGEQVVEGSATFDRSQANTLNVNQATDKMIANYNSFSIAQPEAVNFMQPSSSSIALNRVVGVDPSLILGTLTANGRIFLVNPNGVTFGQGCKVDTMGLVASTLNMSNADFMAGRYSFVGDGGSVVNLGYLSAPGGYVALLGSRVENQGIIEAELGSVALASGKAVTLKLDPKGLISVVIDEATVSNVDNKDDAVKNSGTINVNGGKVLLTAQALDGVFKNAVNTDGVIEANSIGDLMGEVAVEANQRVAIGGTINAEGGTVRVDSQGADYNGAIHTRFGIYNAHGGDTFITGGSYSGDDQIWEDDFNIFVSGDTYVDDGSVYINAGGDLSFTDASLITDNGDIILLGKNISIEDSYIEATRGSGETVFLTMQAENNISVKTTDDGEYFSTLLAQIYGSGNAYVSLEAGTVPGGAGSTLSIVDSDVTARIYGEGAAHVGIYNENGPVDISGSQILAHIAAGARTAEVDIEAVGDITIDDSSVTALVDFDGTAEIYLNPLEGGISISNGSEVVSQVGGCGEAGVYMYNYELENEFDIPLLGESIDFGGAIPGDISISGDSHVIAEVANELYGDTAVVYMNTEGTIDLSDYSTIEANELDGTAAIAMIAGGDINIDDTSSVTAFSNDSLSAVIGLAGNNINAYGAVDAVNYDGVALVGLLAMNDVYAGSSAALSYASGGPDAINMLEDLINTYIFGYDTQYIEFDRQYCYNGFSLFSSLMGNVYLGDVQADAVIVAALGLGGEGSGSIYDAGTVSAHYLGMLAACDIGNAEAPIQTDVDILSAYSYCCGDIYINQANGKRMLELGMYLPITLYNLDEDGDDGPEWVPYEDLFEIGASVAANDGIVHITTEGDMLVNSIIALRGGVFLESKSGNIYAGHGWCPIISQATIDSNAVLAGALVDFLLMNEDGEDTGTVETIAGIFEDFVMDATFLSAEEDENLYLSPFMTGFPMKSSVNVWATGYSYFSTPNGTIGVDPGDDADLQGAVKGIARPGAAEGLLQPGFDRVPASGYVTYEDADSDIYQAAVIYEPAVNSGPVQIWPDPAVTPFEFAAPLNPLQVCIQVLEGSSSAAPERGGDEPFSAVAGLTLNYSVYVPPV
ncbi:MAG: filamentous hemagglutinin N-terminal domain-containing protein, partial [Candidatus Omnitrophota bacterium]